METARDRQRKKAAAIQAAQTQSTTQQSGARDRQRAKAAQVAQQGVKRTQTNTKFAEAADRMERAGINAANEHGSLAKNTRLTDQQKTDWVRDRMISTGAYSDAMNRLLTKQGQDEDTLKKSVAYDWRRRHASETPRDVLAMTPNGMPLSQNERGMRNPVTASEIREASAVVDSDKAAVSKQLNEDAQKIATMNIPEERQRQESYADQMESLLNREKKLQDYVDRAETYRDFGDEYELGRKGLESVQRQIEDLKRSTPTESEIDEAERMQAILRMENRAKRNVNFGIQSQYKSTAKAGGGQQNAEGMYLDTGYDDVLYDAVNGDKNARGIIATNDIRSGVTLNGIDADSIAEMTQDEVKVFNYLYAAEGKQQAYNYLSALQRDLTSRARETREEWFRQYAEEHPVQASAFSVAAAQARGVSYLNQLADYTAIKTGVDGTRTNGYNGRLYNQTLDRNASYNRFSDTPNAIREEVENRIASGFGKFLYQTGMSIADFLTSAVTAVGNEPMALAIMATGAAADATNNALERGLSDGQAIALGTVAGLAEIVTEKVSIEALLDTTKLGESAVGYLFKNLFSEGTEELGSDFINLFADILISKDQSEWEQSIREYEESGYSEENAFLKAFEDQALNMGLDFLGGALSGFAMAAGPAMTQGAMNQIARRTGSIEAANVTSDANTQNGAVRQTARDAQGGVDGAVKETAQGNENAAQNATESVTENAARRETVRQTQRQTQSSEETARNETTRAAENAAQNEAQSATRNAQQETAGSEGTSPAASGDMMQDARARQRAKAQEIQRAKDQAAKRNAGELTPEQQAARAREAEIGTEAEQQTRLQAEMDRLGRELNVGRITEEEYNNLMDDLLDANGEEIGGEALTTEENADTLEEPQIAANPEAWPTEENIRRREEENRGRRVFDAAGGERAAGPRAEEQTEGVAGRAGEAEGSGVQSKAAGRNPSVYRKIQSEKVTPVSAWELGISIGSRTKNVHILPEESWDAELQELAREVRAAGHDVTFVTDRMEVWNAHTNRMQKVPAANIYGNIIVNAAETRDTARQLVEHELYHSKADGDRGLVARTWETLTEQYGADTMNRMLAETVEDYQGIYGREADDMIRYQEEALADLYAGRNRRARRGGTLNEMQRTVRQEASGAKAVAPEGERLSVGRTTDNRPFVEVENDILAGVPEEKWVKTVKENLKKKFPNGITVGNNEINIDKQSRREMTFSRYMQMLYNRDPQLRADKLRATDNADEILQATTDWVNEGLKHPRKDDIRDFARGEVLMRVGGNDYAADVVVGTRENGSMVLYDVLNLQPASFTKKETDAAITVNPSPGAGRSTAPISENNIRENSEKSNPYGKENFGGNFAMAGERSRTADLEALQRAKELAENDVAAETILEQTGWYQGRDGKWRFEIDDSGMEYRRDADANLMQEEGYRRLQELTAREERGELTNQEREEMNRLEAEYEARVFEEKFELSDFLQHDALFEAYPQLRHTGLRFEALEPGTNGFYDRRNGTIVLSQELIGAPEATLLHEIQHVIQGVEGFTGGSSPRYWNEQMENGADIRRNDGAIREGETEYRRILNEAPEEFREKVQQLERAQQAGDMDAAEAIVDELLGGEYADLWNELDMADFQRRMDRGEQRLPSDLYRNTAGEIEARDVAARKDLTAEERRNRMPELGDENTVFADSGENFAMPAEPQIAENPEAWPTEENRRNAQQEAQQTDTQQEAAEKRTPFEQLNTRAKEYTERAERVFAREIAQALSLPGSVKKEFLQNAVREMTNEYLESGKVGQKRLDEMFNRMHDEGVVMDREYYDTYKEVRDFLKSTPMYVEEPFRPRDWNDFKKRAFGSLRLADEGRGVDSVYAEVQAMAPGLFPESIIAPGDQLQRMYDVSSDIRIAKKSLDEAAGADAAEFRKWAKNEWNAAAANAMEKLNRVIRYRDQPVQGQTAYTAETIRPVYDQVKIARREMEKAKALALLTNQELAQAAAVAKGTFSAKDLRGPNAGAVAKVADAMRSYEDLVQKIRDYNEQRRQALRDEADEYLKDAASWKDKKTGLQYSTETLERNIRDIVTDKDTADKMVHRYVTEYKNHEAARTRDMTRLRNQVREMNLSREIKPGDVVSEAHAVQLYGEAEDAIRMLERSGGRMDKREGKTLEDWRGIIQNLWLENPGLDQNKIRSAVQEFRSIYDELLKRMNDTRVENGYEPISYRSGYFPHFQPGEGDGILRQFAKNLGMSMDVTSLPTSINGLTKTFKPGIRWIAAAQERLGYSTVYDAVEGFDKYLEGVSDVIYHTGDIQAQRALANQIRYRTTDEGIQKQIDEIRNNPELSEDERQDMLEAFYADNSKRFQLSHFVVDLEEHINTIANKRSSEDRAMEEKLGRNIYNLMKSVEGRVAANMVAINPGSWLTNFIPISQAWATTSGKNILRGMWDTLKNIKKNDGFADVSNFLTNRRGSEQLVKNYEQTTNASQAAQTAKRLSGIWSEKLGKPMDVIDSFTSEAIVRARYRQNLERKMSEALAMEEADSWAADIMADRSKGAAPNIFNARNPLTKAFTQFQLEVNNELRWIAKDLPRMAGGDKKKLAAMIAKFLLGAWLYNQVYEFVVGRKAALDPIGIVNDSVGDFTGYQLPNVFELGIDAVRGDASLKTNRETLPDAIGNLGGNLADEVPFIGGLLGGGRIPISSALPDAGNLINAATNRNWSAKKRLATAGKELGGSIGTYLLPPFGGGAVKKLWQTTKGLLQGGVYGMDAEGNDQLKYPLYMDSPWDAAKTIIRGTLFGPTTTQTGREWIENGYGYQSAKKTGVYKDMRREVGDREAWQTLQGMQDAGSGAQQREALQNLDADERAKAIYYYGMMATDAGREQMDALTDAGEDAWTAAKYLMDRADAEGSRAKREALLDSGLTGKGKLLAYAADLDEDSQELQYIMGLDKSAPAEEIVQTLCAIKDANSAEDKSQAKRAAVRTSGLSDADALDLYTSIISSNEDRNESMRVMQRQGMSIGQILDAADKYAQLSKENGSAAQKATAFSAWVDRQKIPAAAKDTVKDAYGFYSQMRQDAERYESFRAAGLTADESEKLDTTLRNLKPVSGKTTVSELQRLEAVTKQGLSAEKQTAAFRELMGEDSYAKFRQAQSYGVTPKIWVQWKTEQQEADADGNGNLNQTEAESAIRKMFGLLPSPDELAMQAALWQLTNKSWKSKNNPFDQTIGQEVYERLHAD